MEQARINIAMLMDPLPQIKPYKDSSFALLLEAQQRQWKTFVMTQAQLFVKGGVVYGEMQTIRVWDGAKPGYELGESHLLPLKELQVVFMRKDPPMDMAYIYTTYLLELAQQQGTLVVNHPRALRDFNEKLFILQFPQCIVDTIVTSLSREILGFLAQHGDIILKPLGSMGGEAIFRVKHNDPNINVIIEILTQRGHLAIMAQKFIPEISQGDKRIILVNGEPVPYALARIPKPGESRGNLAAGGTGVGLALSPRDQWICTQLAPTLKNNGLLFVGIDVIGDYLTEINITSPTGIRELDRFFNLNIAAQILDQVALCLS